MEKLEQILRAEDEARHTLEEAKSRAQTIARESQAEATLILSAAEREAAEESAGIRDRILESAHEESRRIEREAETKLARSLEAAEGRFSDAVSGVVERVSG